MAMKVRGIKVSEVAQDSETVEAAAVVAKNADLKMVDGKEVESKAKAQRFFQTREEAEAVDPPRLCTACGENPKWVVKKRDTGFFWHLSKYRSSETERQRTNRAKRKARNTDLADVVSGKSAGILAKCEVSTVCELLKSNLDIAAIKGIGPKSQAALAEFVELNNLALVATQGS